MNICIMRHAYFPDDPTIRKEVFAILGEGQKVDVICLKRKGQRYKECIKGANVYRIPLTHKRGGIFRYFSEYLISFFIMSILIFILFLLKHYDCIQINTMPDFLAFSTFLPKVLGAKILVHFHEPTPELWVTKYGNDQHRWLLKIQIIIEQKVIMYSHRCITVTESLRQRLGKRGADIRKIVVIPNVCEEETFYWQNKKQNENGLYRLVTHGLIEKRYGHELVVWAINHIKSDIGNFIYEIIGEGPYKKQIENLIIKLDCVKYIKLLGFIPFEELLEKLHSADVGIIPMEWSPYSELVETTKMYEYMALKIPVIGPSLKAVQENLDESCLMYFEPGNYKDLARCILELYKKPEKRGELVENAYRRYVQIRWNRTKNAYLKTLQDINVESRL